MGIRLQVSLPPSLPSYRGTARQPTAEHHTTEHSRAQWGTASRRQQQQTDSRQEADKRSSISRFLLDFFSSTALTHTPTNPPKHTRAFAHTRNHLPNQPLLPLTLIPKQSAWTHTMARRPEMSSTTRRSVRPWLAQTRPNRTLRLPRAPIRACPSTRTRRPAPTRA